MKATICKKATTTYHDPKKVWDYRQKNFVTEAKSRGLDCGLDNRDT